MSEQPDDQLAGVSEPVYRESIEPDPDTAREVHPVMFEKDLMDFRPVIQRVGDEVEDDPKLSSAPASVVSPQSPTGLEDVSEIDLETPVQPNVEKGTRTTSTTPTVSGPPSSYKGI